MDVLSAELVWGQVLPVDDPGVFEDLNCRQALLRVHVEHLGHDVLQGRVSGAGAGVRAAPAQSRPPPPYHAKPHYCPESDSVHLGSNVCFQVYKKVNFRKKRFNHHLVDPPRFIYF